MVLQQLMTLAPATNRHDLSGHIAEPPRINQGGSRQGGRVNETDIETASRGRRGATPRYVEVADDLRARIDAGEFANGGQMPTENALCERHGVSRFTVREALRRLQAEGLVRRRRGSGTTVDRGATALRQPLSDVAELLQYAAGSEFRFDIHGLITLADVQATDLGLPVGSRWVHLSGVRTLTPGGTPLALTDVFIHPDLAPHVAGLRPGRVTLFEQLSTAAGFRIARIEQDIRATAANGRESAALGIPRRTPILRILRHYRDESGRTVELSLSAHPGDRFTYSMHIDQP
jgi:DNA-binding GntR family transcriptional regulator